MEHGALWSLDDEMMLIFLSSLNSLDMRHHFLLYVPSSISMIGEENNNIMSYHEMNEATRIETKNRTKNRSLFLEERPFRLHFILTFFFLVMSHPASLEM